MIELKRNLEAWGEYLRLKQKYSMRNINCMILRSYYDGIDYYRQLESGRFLDSIRTASSSDTSREQISDTGYYLVFNLLNNMINKLIFQLAVMPEVQMQILEEPMIEDKIKIDKLEKLMYGIFDLNQMKKVSSNFAFFFSLLGIGVLQALPSERNILEFSSLVPENFYPEMEDLDGRWISHCFYENIIGKTKAKLMFPGFESVISGAVPSITTMGEITAEDEKLDDDKVCIVYAFNESSITIMCRGYELQVINHKFNFIPIEYCQAIPRPGRLRGQSAIEQAIHIASLFSDMLNYQADIMAYNAAPVTDVYSDEHTKQASDLRNEPGAVEFWKSGDKVQSRTSNMSGALPVFINNLRDLVLDMGHMNKLQYTRMDKSIDSGQVLSGLMGEFVLMISYFQSIIGETWSRLISNGVTMIGMTRSKKLIIGAKKGQYATPLKVEVEPEIFRKHIQTWLTWPFTHYDYAQLVNLELQKLGAGVQSVYTTMEKLGIKSPVEELTKVIEHARVMHGIKSGIFDMGGGDGDNRQFERKPGQEQLPTDKENTNPEASHKPESAPPENVSADSIRKILSGLKLKGAVHAMGGLVTKGGSSGTIDLALTDMRDKAAILNSPDIAPYKDRVRFIARAGRKKSA